MQAHQHDKKSTPHTYTVGDKVLLYKPQEPYVRLGRAAKLGKRWLGPFEVTEVLPPNLMVRRIDVKNQEPFRTHMRRAKPFIDRESDTPSSDEESEGSTAASDNADAAGNMLEPPSYVPQPQTPRGHYNLRPRHV